MKIVWSPKAVQDLNRIVDFIAQDKVHAALRWVQGVYRKVSRLQRFPKSGRIVPETNRPDLREILMGSCRIIYKIGSEISILTVFHGAKTPEDLR